MKDKVIILYSSGLDSLVNLHILKDLWNLDPILLFVNYNQKASSLEYEMTSKVASKLSLPLIYREVDLEVESKLITGNSDTKIDADDSREAPVEIVPYRNISLAHIGILTARKHGAKYVSFGFNVSEAGAYPDNTPRFLDALNNLYLSSTYYPYEPMIKFISGSIHFTKTELVLLGKHLNADFSLSTSCYYPSESGKACGVCTSCRYRIEAFRRAGVRDTVEYNIDVHFEERNVDQSKIDELLRVLQLEYEKQVLSM